MTTSASAGRQSRPRGQWTGCVGRRRPSSQCWPLELRAQEHVGGRDVFVLRREPLVARYDPQSAALRACKPPLYFVALNLWMHIHRGVMVGRALSTVAAMGCASPWVPRPAGSACDAGVGEHRRRGDARPSSGPPRRCAATQWCCYSCRSPGTFSPAVTDPDRTSAPRTADQVG